MIQQQLVELKAQQSSVNELIKMIQENTDIETLVSKNVRYSSYVSNRIQLLEALKEAETSFKRSIELFATEIISLSELENIEKIYNNAEQSLVNYESSYIANMDQELSNLNMTLTSKQMEYDSAKIGGERLDNELSLTEATLNKQRIDTIVSIESEIESTKREQLSLNNNIKLIQLDIEKAIIKAPVGGKLSILRETAIGDTIMSGTNLVSIIPPNEDMFKVHIMIQNKDVADIKVGDAIKFNFQALPYKDYGYLTGTITSISTDIKSNSQASGFYLIEAKLDYSEVVNSKNEMKTVKMGMTSEAHIITEQKQILSWLLQKIDLLD